MENLGNNETYRCKHHQPNTRNGRENPKHIYTMEEIDTLVKENAKCKKLLIQNIQVIWDNMKQPNLKIRE